MIGMNDKIQYLQIQANDGRKLYNANLISRDEAKEMIMPYINYANKMSKEIAQKYDMKPKYISFISYIR